MSGSWHAEVVRLNPASDVLLVKVKGRIDQQMADTIRAQVRAVLPDIRTLIADDAINFVVVRKTRRKTLTLAARQR
jgi:hypothetical protein